MNTLPAPSAAADCDVLIAGAGAAGASLAAALAGLPLRVTLADARADIALADAGRPVRTIALTLGSLRILAGLDATPPGADIARVHVSDHGHFGRVVLDAGELGLARLGRVAGEAALRGALLARHAGERLMPARLTGLAAGADAVRATFATAHGERTLTTRLLVAADGTESTACALAGMPLRERPAETAALVGGVRTSLPHAGAAFERFTDTGPVAFLPGLEPRVRHFVWTLPTERAQRLVRLPGGALLALLAQRFGARAGRLEALAGVALFPLRTAHRDPLRGRVLALGNAAHTLHPVAAQGFNLGLRDVAALADLLAPVARTGGDPGAASLLARYVRARRADWYAARTFTRLLPALFEDEAPPLALARTLGMTALELAPPAKRAFARYAMGLWRPRTRLERACAP